MNRDKIIIEIEDDGEASLSSASGHQIQPLDPQLYENAALFALQWAVPSSFPILATTYIVGLIAIVAASVGFPFYAPLLYLLMAWLGVFFLFALLVLSLTFSMMGIAAYRWFKNVFSKNKSMSGSLLMWDQWLDSMP
jgi:hypothetical protein